MEAKIHVKMLTWRFARPTHIARAIHHRYSEKTDMLMYLGIDLAPPKRWSRCNHAGCRGYCTDYQRFSSAWRENLIAGRILRLRTLLGPMMSYLAEQVLCSVGVGMTVTKYILRFGAVTLVAKGIQSMFARLYSPADSKVISVQFIRRRTVLVLVLGSMNQLTRAGQGLRGMFYGDAVVTTGRLSVHSCDIAQWEKVQGLQALFG